MYCDVFFINIHVKYHSIIPMQALYIRADSRIAVTSLHMKVS